ncbi:Hypothetical protein FKW44_007444 [Caligus rogercresseyi]|uniref:Uncharacterized protein n=1 Tax=Caligus rogercresseyi TaxID=217165 RepID=A0A7T8KER1_CALRO|nr:Hypothetical protein FKW44_007444 [Caligus rogercresseyi]
MSHEETNREKIADLLQAKVDKKRSWNLLGALWLQFTMFQGSKDVKGTGRTPGSGGANKKRT